MGRAPRPLFPGGTYHVTARGNDRRRIFVDPQDWRQFLALMDEAAGKYGWHGLAYCLMGNHVHLLVCTPHGNLDEGMRDLLGRFARFSNWKHRRGDHLFGRRYHSVVIETDEQLVATIRYIAQNPVRHGATDHPGRWRWSSYTKLTTQTPAAASTGGFLDEARALAPFHQRPAHARALLRTCVEADLADLRNADADGTPTATRPAPSVATLQAALTPDDALDAAMARGDPPGTVARRFGIDRTTLWRRTTGRTSCRGWAR